LIEILAGHLVIFLPPFDILTPFSLLNFIDIPLNAPQFFRPQTILIYGFPYYSNQSFDEFIKDAEIKVKEIILKFFISKPFQNLKY